MKILINKYRRWKLKKLEEKIDKIFDDLGCDELFYIKFSGELYAIWWDCFLAKLDNVTEKKDERIRLIKEYIDLREACDGES